MKRLLLALVLLTTALLSACGVSEPTIPSTTTAASMNLNVEDLDRPATLEQDINLPEILSNIMQTPEPDTVRDANQRVFALSTGQVTSTQAATLTSIILVYDSATNARANLQPTLQSIEETLQTQLPGIKFSPINVSQIGDETTLVGADVPNQNAQVYLLLFRKNNVLSILDLVTPTGAITPDWLASVANKILMKIPATTGQ